MGEEGEKIRTAAWIARDRHEEVITENGAVSIGAKHKMVQPY